MSQIYLNNTSQKTNFDKTGQKTVLTVTFRSIDCQTPLCTFV